MCMQCQFKLRTPPNRREEGRQGKEEKREREGKEAYLLEAAFSFFCFASEDK